MKLWDCRVLNDAKGPVKTWEDLPAAYERQGVCGSPDGKYVVTGTSREKNDKGHCYLKVFSVDDFSVVKNLDFGERSVVSCEWQREINQLCVGTSKGELV